MKPDLQSLNILRAIEETKDQRIGRSDKFNNYGWELKSNNYDIF